MGRPIHSKIKDRVRELLKKGDLTIPMIAKRVGISASQVRNLKRGTSNKDYHSRHPMQDEFDGVFGDDTFDLPAPIEIKPPSASDVDRREPLNSEHDMFDKAPEKPGELRSLTPKLEHKVIADLHGNMPLALVAKNHRVPLAEVQLLSERVYWLEYEDDPNIVTPCRLTVQEYRQIVGPRLTAAQMKMLRPQIDWVHELIMETLFVDLATAETIGKVVMKHHLETGWKPTPPLPASDVDDQVEQIVAELFSEIVEPSDELESLASLCLRFFKREPDEFTIDAWTNGKNDRQQKLETFEVDGELVTTEKHFREYFGCFTNRS